MNDYLTPGKAAEEEYVVQKSRFIGYVCPVSSTDEANEFVKKIRALHPQARHNVYAYVVREPEYSRYSDDGEPQGTAGMPVLDVLKKGGVTDAVIVVTRYFGGILLGTGGLVRAYSHTASLALQKAGIVRMSQCAECECRVDYSFYTSAQQLLTSNGAVVDDTVFENDVRLVFHISDKDFENLKSKIFDASNGRFTPEKTGESFLPLSD